MFNIVHLQEYSPKPAVNYSLSCWTDYLYSVNCTLRVEPKELHSHNHSYWLTFCSFDDVLYDCRFTWNYSYYFCSFDTLNQPKDYESGSPATFMDTDDFKVTLRHNREGNISENNSTLFVTKFNPVDHILPRIPCCLTVSWNSSQYHFSWKSSYEEYLPHFYLIDSLKYELQYQKSGYQDNVVKLSSTIMNIPVDDNHFEPDTAYVVKVRSSPKSKSFYFGQWSDWGSEVHWKTNHKPESPGNTVVPLLGGKFIIPLCVLAPMLLFLCYIPVVRLRRKTLIPTPEPYFKSLYNDCKGDFKSWVLTPSNECDYLKTEETLKIDTVTDTILDEGTTQLLLKIKGTESNNPMFPPTKAALLGSSPATGPGDTHPVPSGPMKSLSFSPDTEYALEVDSGCWRCSVVSLERVPLYTNEYCILSDTLGTARNAHEVARAEDGCSESSFSETMSDGHYVDF